MIPAGHWERILVSPELLRIAMMFLAALSVGGIAYVVIMPWLSDERKASKRIADVSLGQAGVAARRSAVPEAVSMRKQQVLKLVNTQEKSPYRKIQKAFPSM